MNNSKTWVSYDENDDCYNLNMQQSLHSFRSQFNLPDPETPLGALLDEAKHTGNLLFTVWMKMKDIIEHSKQCFCVLYFTF